MSPRNHFSNSPLSPCFINDGISKHNDPKPQEDIKPNKNLFYFISIGFVSVLVIIGIVLTSLL